jgi:superkiller protein 3
MRIRWLPLLAVLALTACAAPSPTLSPLPSPSRPPVRPTATPIVAQEHYLAGRAHRAAGDTHQALAAFSRAVAADPYLAPAYVERGTIYLKEGDYDAALADAQGALEADPDHALAHVLLGEVLRLGFDDPVQALRVYERAVRLDPTLKEMTFPARWRAAVAAGRPDRMIALANEYLNAHPEDPFSAYYLSRALMARGSRRAAIETLTEAIEIGGGRAALWFALGQAYAAERAWSEAGLSYEQARALTERGDNSLALISDHPTADLSAALGEAYVYTGRCTDAQAMLNHALAIGPDRPMLHTLIGQALICQTPTPTPTPYPWRQ